MLSKDLMTVQYQHGCLQESDNLLDLGYEKVRTTLLSLHTLVK
jgi:hypothetical protein